ncbi:MAG: CHAD domain-containing protein [Erysipelothrix sp.]|nr:CHAD domain-containing protein [Erysipelothrix sp.]
MGEQQRQALTEIIQNAVETIEEPLNKVIALDDDIEAVHQFRVKIRQVRSLIAFFKPRLNEELADEINRRLKEMANVFSNVRELDVLYQRWLTIVDDQSPQDHDFGLALLQAKQQARIEAYSHFRATQAKSDIDWIKRTSKNLFSDDKKLGDFIEQRMKQWLKRIRKGIKKLDITDYPAMHQLRIEIKRLRYALTLLNEHTDELMSERIKPSKLWAEQLGIVCDYQRNKEMLNELFVRDIEPKIKLLKSMKNEADEILIQLEKTQL